MARSSNQKLKLLYLAKILMENTDENHPMTVAEMISSLSQYGISAERKSIYDDLESLGMFGLDIVTVKARSTGYYIGSREFELPELKLLVDVVQSSKFITQKKTLSLIKKIESLASRYDAQLLARQVYVQNRVKSMNESVYYNVDEISAAISADRAVRFRYFEYVVGGGQRFRKNGEYYITSPFAMIWDDENYYLLAYDHDAGMLKHFRMDKMSTISPLDEPRQGREVFADMDMASYTKRVFGMFSGEVRTVQMRFSNHLVGSVIDRFGKDIITTAFDGESFTVTAPVAVSPQFFAWLFGFGCDAEILYPDDVRRMMKQRLEETAEAYLENREQITENR